MEIVVLLGVGIAVAVLLYRRSRAGGSVDDPDRARQGHEHDSRESNSYSQLYAAVRAPNPVSRESGSGKDGGG